MKSLLIAAAALLALPALCVPCSAAQSIDDLNLQIHGYATQGFFYTNHNSWDTTDSDNGSAAWTEAVLNLTVQPEPKLRVGVQARYYLLGDYGNKIELDWAEADYKVNEYFGFRVGDVKTPVGLLNETQDIDPAHLWILLPQSIYPIASRDSLLDHYGGVLYGAIPLGNSIGTLEYRAFAGQRVVGSRDGAFQSLRDAGFTAPNGLTGKTFGGTLRWRTPIRGMFFGASENAGVVSGEVTTGPYSGTLDLPQARQLWYFGKIERDKWMFAGEYSRNLSFSVIQIPTLLTFSAPGDNRLFYSMASYKLARKLTAGLYYSSFNDHHAPFNSARYQKDWAIAARYDFNPFLYAKAEQHFIDGTAIGFAMSDNPNLQPTTRMTMFKFGVSF